MEPKPKTGLYILLAGIVYLYFQTVLHGLSTEIYGPGLEFVLRFSNVDLAEYVRRYVLTNSYYPPLYFVFLLLVHLPFGMDFLPYVLANALFAAGGAVFVYLTLARHTKEWAAGAASAVFLLLPGVCFFTKTLALEQPLVFLIPLCIYLLDAADGFSRRGRSVLIGLVAGLGMLTKWTFAAYTVCFFAAALARAFVREGSGFRPRAPEPRRMINAALCVGAALAVAGPWYLGVMDFSKFLATASNDPNFPEFALGRQFLFNLGLLSDLTGRWLLILVGAAVLAAIAFSKARLRAVGMVVAILVPLLLLSLPRHLEDRYIYPLCVLIPLLASATVAKPRKKALLIMFWCVLGAVALGENTRAYVFGRFDPQPLRTNFIYDQEGRLKWGAVKTRDLLNAVADDGRRRFPNEKATITSHPLWFNVHCNTLNIRYLLAIEPRFGALKLDDYSKFRYLDFGKSLRQGRFDYIFLGCEAPGVCSDDPEASVQFRPQDLMNRDYLDQRMGILFEKYGRQDVLDDLAVIRARYEPLAEVRPDEETRIRIYARKDSVDSQGPGPVEPTGRP